MPVKFSLPSDISVCGSIRLPADVVKEEDYGYSTVVSKHKSVLSRCDSKALKPWPYCTKVLRRRPNTSARPQETFTSVGKLAALGGQSHEYLPLIKTQVNQ